MLADLSLADLENQPITGLAALYPGIVTMMITLCARCTYRDWEHPRERDHNMWRPSSNLGPKHPIVISWQVDLFLSVWSRLLISISRYYLFVVCFKAILSNPNWFAPRVIIYCGSLRVMFTSTPHLVWDTLAINQLQKRMTHGEPQYISEHGPISLNYFGLRYLSKKSALKNEWLSASHNIFWRVF